MVDYLLSHLGCWEKFPYLLLNMIFRPLVKSAYPKINFLISQTKHVVGTQKNRLNERVLLSIQNMLKLVGWKIFTIVRHKFCSSYSFKHVIL